MFRVTLFITYVIRIVSPLTLKTGGGGGGDLIAKSLPRITINIEQINACGIFMRWNVCSSDNQQASNTYNNMDDTIAM